MLKKDPTATFRHRKVAPLFNRRSVWDFYTDRNWYIRHRLEDKVYLQLVEYQKHTPAGVLQDSKGRTWWMFKDEFWYENEGYAADEMRALILDKLERRRRKINRAKARLAQDESVAQPSHDPIPDDVKMFVWRRDSGRCVKCGAQQNLEYDHIIPVSKGGSNTARNIQLLCESCNRAKGGNLF